MEGAHDSQFLSLSQAMDTVWDVVIVGAGMGGGVTAYNLAKKGIKVLLIEKGKKLDKIANTLITEQSSSQERLESGKWPTRIKTMVDRTEAEIWVPLGCGLGGSTLLYAAALQRFHPIDFESTVMPDGRTIEWPFKYQDLEDFYLEAENLFKVCGEVDPDDTYSTYKLVQPPKPSEVDSHLIEEFAKAGLKPHHLHVGMDFKVDSRLNDDVEKMGKSNSYNRCIKPGMDTGHLFVLTEAEGLKLEANEKFVESVHVTSHGSEGNVQGRIFVISAGAYHTPAILLNSVSDSWPKGVANSSDMVGRNLMFHASDFIAFWPTDRKLSNSGPGKTITSRAFYVYDGDKLGDFQSLAREAGYGNIMYSFRLAFDQSIFRKLKILRHFLRIPAYIGAKVLGKAAIFATIVEDMPYKHNRVIIDKSQPSGISFEYQISDELRKRVSQLQRLIRNAAKNLRSMALNQDTKLNYGHPCGTCSAGEDSHSSVVNENCRTHDMTNLYIVDSSFMPTSGGTNPGLTIAANALRVSGHILTQLQKKNIADMS